MAGLEKVEGWGVGGPPLIGQVTRVPVKWHSQDSHGARVMGVRREFLIVRIAVFFVSIITVCGYIKKNILNKCVLKYEGVK